MRAGNKLFWSWHSSSPKLKLAYSTFYSNLHNDTFMKFPLEPGLQFSVPFEHAVNQNKAVGGFLQEAKGEEKVNQSTYITE